MHTESLTRIFLTFLLMQRDSKRICKRYRLRLLRRMKNEETKFGGRRESQLYNLEFIVLSKASAHALAKSV